MFFLSSWKTCFKVNDELLHGSRCISYLGPVEMENDPLYFLPKDTFEVYKKGVKILYKRSFAYDSVSKGVTIFSVKLFSYFLFDNAKETGLYYFEKFNPNYKILNNDSMIKANFKGIIINDTTDLTFLMKSVLSYDNKGNLSMEKYLMPSKCSGRKDTILLYYSSISSYNLITLSPYIDSLRNTKLVKCEVFACAPDTTNPTHLYRVTAKREIQDIGIIQVKDPVYKIFAKMEKQYSKMIQ